jgi:Asp-tRNA(Asn)/Glu-tRNA(Gln) amidotransferase A subunit family amidase
MCMRVHCIQVHLSAEKQPSGVVGFATSFPSFIKITRPSVSMHAAHTARSRQRTPAHLHALIQVAALCVGVVAISASMTGEPERLQGAWSQSQAAANSTAPQPLLELPTRPLPTNFKCVDQSSSLIPIVCMILICY